MVDLVTIVHNDMNRSFAERLRVGLELYEPDNYRLIVRDNFAVNLGFAKGCNWGAKQATSDIIGFVNPDVIVHGAFLDRVSEVFTDENVVITGESFREPGHAYGQLSQLLHITDTNEVYLHNGTRFVPIITNRTPSSATDTGIKGQVAYDTNYIYVCVNSNVWKRVSISTW